MKWALIAAGFTALLLATTTYVALELNGVLIVQTTNHESGALRQTSVWYVPEEQGSYLLEAGHPDNPWVVDLQEMNTLYLHGKDLDGEYSFTRLGQDSHQMIRDRMRAKYGWRDWWISILFDTSKSYAIKITRNNT